MLLAACRAEVVSRHREFNATKQYKQHVWGVSKWLTSQDSTFGLFLCGGVGNGKTTLLRALQSLITYLRSNESYKQMKSFRFVAAKELVRLAKAHGNRESDDAQQYHKLLDSEILAIDDLGQEPKESIHYGDSVTAAIDVLSYRYDHQLCTLVSSNLAPNKIADYYDERIADRFREMMLTINFSTEKSFRTL